MILFGTRTSHSTDYSQPFQCPRCNMQRNGIVKSAKRWFTKKIQATSV
ncbi:MAG: hypothetical protein JSS27_18915 [Planctomycetes bacterium]|nr:hypothetical protein [Planctomycetota bacterium]